MTWQEQLWAAVRPAVTTGNRSLRVRQWPGICPDVVMPRSILERDWHPFLDVVCVAHGWTWRCIYPGDETCRVVIEKGPQIPPGYDDLVCEFVVRHQPQEARHA